ncbi:LysM domain-containing protein [Xylariaceae sp. FL0804]|nr:LysM domain-containing protein [Xylariaceae sp. FL0804]
MGRWSQYDTDEERLPEGMQRIGYDADTEIYSFRDSDGSIWESAPGNRYGSLRRVSPPPAPPAYEEAAAPLAFDVVDDSGHSHSHGHDFSHEEDTARLLSGARAVDGDTRPSWRQEMRPLLTWFMIVSLFLLGVFWLIGGTARNPPAVTCADGSSRYLVRSGDTCWAIAEARSVPLEALMRQNLGLDCSGLTPGQTLCVPQP